MRKKAAPVEVEIEVDGHEYPCLFYECPNRKTASITIKEGDVFAIRYPPSFYSQAFADHIKNAIRNLLRRKARAKALPKPYDEKGYWLLGEYIEDQSFMSLSDARKEVIYAKALLSYIEENLPIWAKKLNRPAGIRFVVKPIKRAYGIYHKKGRWISFSTILAPYSPFAIDSVIAHELTHDEVHDHSASFYRILEGAFPDYWEARKELLQHDYQRTHPKRSE